MVRKTALLLLPFLFACSDGADTLDTAGRVDPGQTASAAATSTDAGDVSAGTDSVATGKDRLAILFLGTSLTAGYGVGAENAFPAVIQEKIDSAGLPYRVINAGLSGETSAGGLRRLDWSLQEPIDVLVLELGANDGLRGLPVDQLRANLDSIISRTRARYPDVAVLIAGMEAPPNLGARYTAAFRNTFQDLAAQRDAALVPFLLADVGGIAELNQADGIHPTAAGHRIVADNVWHTLEPMLQRRTSDR